MSDCLGNVAITSRNFSLIEFVDHYGEKCSLECSSIIGDYDDAFARPGSSCVWLGIDKPTPKILARNARNVGVETKKTTGWVEYPIPDGVSVSARMHLNREQVSGLIKCLQEWLEEGCFIDNSSAA